VVSVSGNGGNRTLVATTPIGASSPPRKSWRGDEAYAMGWATKGLN